MFIGFSPAGFIMNMTMNSAMTIISTAIMKNIATPRYTAASSSMIVPTAMNDTSRKNDARTIESVRNTRQPV